MDYVGQPAPRCLPYLFVFEHRDGAPTRRDYRSLVYLAPRTWPWVGNNHFVPETPKVDDLYKDIRLRGETWGLVVNDAMNFALPVVVRTPHHEQGCKDRPDPCVSQRLNVPRPPGY